MNRLPNIIVHLKEPILPISSYIGHDAKFHSFYDKEKLIHHKNLLLSDISDKKLESAHLKKLMQKLGAVYQDDLVTEPHDFVVDTSGVLDDDINGQHIMYHEIHENEFPRDVYKLLPKSASNPTTTTQVLSKAHMRHSGHSGHKARAIPLIGGCPSSLGIEDGHTIADKTRHYKLCNSVHKLPVCK